MFKFCPKCSKQTIDFIQQRQFICRHCHFNYFHNIAAAVAGIITFENQILLTTRAKDPGAGLLDLPGGFVDANESLEQALTRELKEELNIEIPASDWCYESAWPNQYLYADIQYQTLDTTFSCALSHKPEITKQESEIAQYQWIEIENIQFEQMAFQSLRRALELYISGR
ncbi:NUDIX hydrolase [Algibacillus agarilyticus]|uniref:NUDIX hydrolase n=1 Tax=Algibacillus agarilyticus TaxID=2234133 RepID=UPI000DD012F3|nr:NUDIX domain-containing protein [Algibacillus agarilyticus]